MAENPFPALYGKSATQLVIEDIDAIEVKDIDTITAWMKKEYEESGEKDLREPTIRFALFENQAVSVVRLTHAAHDRLPSIDPSFETAETERTAALVLAAHLLRRASRMAVVPVSADPAGEEVAARRKWSTLQDAIDDLKVYEAKLVRKGSAALRKHRALRDRWEEDKDDGTFEDAADDVRRRLDFAAQPEFKAIFQNSRVNEELLAEGHALYKDAMVFYRGREGRNIPKVGITLARDQAFTLLLKALDELRPLLVEAYEGNEDALKKLEGEFWRLLDRFSKPRKPRKKEPTSAPTSQTDPPEKKETS